MRNLNTPPKLLDALRVLAFGVAVFSFSQGTPSAAELYNLDFTAPETGTYQVVFGSPTVQSSVGPLTDALVFHAAVSGDQISLPIGVSGSRYDLQCDVLTHDLLNSDYVFSLQFDGGGVHSVNFHGGLNNIGLFQSSPYLGQSLSPFSNDALHHLAISVDVAADLWSVAVDGTTAGTNPWNGVPLQSVRFALAPWIGGAATAPGTYVALDNVVLTVVPEPTSISLVALGLLAWRGFMRTKVRS